MPRGSKLHDSRHAAHVRLQSLGNYDRPIGLLIVLEYRDQRTPDREPRAVQRVDVADLLAAFGAVARIHAPRLKVAAHRARGDFSIGILAWQPNLDVVGLLGGKAHVARAEQHGAVGKAEPA